MKSLSVTTQMKATILEAISYGTVYYVVNPVCGQNPIV